MIVEGLLEDRGVRDEHARVCITRPNRRVFHFLIRIPFTTTGQGCSKFIWIVNAEMMC